MEDPDSVSNNWSDFVATPPNFSSSPVFGPYSDYNNSWLQPHFQFPADEGSGAYPGGDGARGLSPPGSAQAPAPAAHSASGGSGFQQFGDFTEIENRTIVISNIAPGITQEEIQRQFDLSDELVRSADFTKLRQGIVTIEYYDLRNALNAKRMKNGSILKGTPIMVSFAQLPKIDDPKKPPNNGTIVVFHLPNGMNDQHIGACFGTYGEIRQIRGTPTKPNQRFIEYFDTRAAEAALTGLSGKYVLGSRVSIEFSLPGGFRRNVQRNLNHI